MRMAVFSKFFCKEKIRITNFCCFVSPHAIFRKNSRLLRICRLRWTDIVRLFAAETTMLLAILGMFPAENVCFSFEADCILSFSNFS